MIRQIEITLAARKRGFHLVTDEIVRQLESLPRMGLLNLFVLLTIDGLRVYIAGDTEDIPEMASLGHIDIALLPCNQPYTMTVDQLINAARMVKPSVLYPYHYGQTDVSGIAAALAGDSIDVRIRHYE